MDMGTPMPMPGGSGLMLVDPSQFDLTNDTQAADFLGQMLDDSILQFDAQTYSRYFWYGIVSVIGVAAVYNLAWKGGLILRIRAAAANRPTIGALGRLGASIRSLCCVATYPQFTPSRAQSWFQLPPLGTLILLGGYLGFILALEYINNDVPGAQYWTSLGVRAGWLAVAQVPLLILLAGKNNLIGLATGLSYERLNILHRWSSRGTLLMAVLHVGYQNAGWNQYGISSLEWSTDTCPPTGMGAFALLLWLNVSTLAPFRNFGYEFFVFQHLLTFFGFIIAIMLHLPSTALETRTYIWIPIGLYLFDRLLRTALIGWNNSRRMSTTVVPIDGEVTKICVSGSRIRKWGPGSFVLLSIPHYGIGQSHPATIASTPESHGGDLVFLLKARKGFTKKLLSSASASDFTLVTSSGDKNAHAKGESHRAFIDGPYGGTQGDFAAFDTVLLVAGSTGITYVLSILLDLAARASKQKLPLRRLELVWAVKRSLQSNWFSEEIESAFSSLQAAGIEANLRVFVTGNDAFRDSADSSGLSGGDGINLPEYTQEPRQESQKSAKLPCATVVTGRPAMKAIVPDLALQAQGELGVAVCGPLGLSTAVRNTVAVSMVKRPIYLHVEGFGW
ncbi:ferric-chelate reductase Frp1 [Friedmanniomyces endolithicus]|nr:ferric-chelate reductase Frp1 [Friedmanniomyces endolithicus]KAK0881991.1 ferric-chelate reductase Frp1 [Friedmanniomyces endolithicus]